MDDLLATNNRHVLQAPNLESQESKRDNLARESLCRGNADFRTGVNVNAASGFACDRRAYDVYDSVGPGPAVLCLAHGGERVGRFAGLRDHDAQRAVVDDRIAVSEFRRVLDLY